jgi:hypothetical protein
MIPWPFYAKTIFSEEACQHEHLVDAGKGNDPAYNSATNNLLASN